MPRGRRPADDLRQQGKLGWTVGTAALFTAKCIENMELGHNIIHGQWDWMNDPEIHSNTWEWDMVGPVVAVAVFAQLPASRIHQRDRDGRGPRLRRDPGQPRPGVEAGLLFGSVAGARCWPSSSSGASPCTSWPRSRTTSRPRRARQSSSGRCFRKMGRQAAKDYLFFPALSGRRSCGRSWPTCAAGFRNAWAYIVIVCGHFADGAEKFTRKRSRTRPSRSGICGRCWERRTSTRGPSWRS